MITGSGWIPTAPGFRRHVLDGRGLADVSKDIFWNLYKVAQDRIELARLRKR
jgi:hypothetical protein